MPRTDAPFRMSSSLAIVAPVGLSRRELGLLEGRLGFFLIDDDDVLAARGLPGRIAQ